MSTSTDILVLYKDTNKRTADHVQKTQRTEPWGKLRGSAYEEN